MGNELIPTEMKNHWLYFDLCSFLLIIRAPYSYICIEWNEMKWNGMDYIRMKRRGIWKR